jgi:hypothetical protein
MTKPNKGAEGKENNKPTTPKNCKNPWSDAGSSDAKDHDQAPVGSIPGVHVRVNTSKSISVTRNTTRVKVENHEISSKEAEKAFDKIQHPLMIKKTKILNK